MMSYEVEEKVLFHEKEKGGILYYVESDLGVDLMLQREGHFLHCFKTRPPMFFLDENGVEQPDTSFLIWTQEKLGTATPVLSMDKGDKKKTFTVLEQ